MSDVKDNENNSEQAVPEAANESRREILKKAGRFAVYTPAAVLLLSRPIHAQQQILTSAMGRPPRGNNGVGNGLDPQPPGNPPINDGPGTGPGNPGNRP